MKAMLKLEAIGDNATQMLRLWRNVIDEALPGLGRATIGSAPPSCWVAEIIGHDPKYKWQRNFLRGTKDYSESNSVGSRGIYIYYWLDYGHIYDVKQPVSWKRTLRYFCRVTDDGKIVEIDESEIDQWLPNDRLESMS